MTILRTIPFTSHSHCHLLISALPHLSTDFPTAIPEGIWPKKGFPHQQVGLASALVEVGDLHVGQGHVSPNTRAAALRCGRWDQRVMQEWW